MGRKCPECQRYLGVIENLTAALTGRPSVVQQARVKPAPVQAEERMIQSERDLFVERFTAEFSKQPGISRVDARAEAERLADEAFANGGTA